MAADNPDSKSFSGHRDLVKALSAASSGHPYCYVDPDDTVEIASEVPVHWTRATSDLAAPARHAYRVTDNTADSRSGNPYASIGESEDDAISTSDNRRTGQLSPSLTRHVRTTSQAARSSNHARQRRRNNEIERVARELQRQLWHKRHTSNPYELLDPELAAKHLGYSFALAENLTPITVGKAEFETAGELNRSVRAIEISRRLKPEARKFTGAHEIGHVLLHKQLVMHRDRPINMVRLENGLYDQTEREADVFAAFFLMPRKLLTKEFLDRFGCAQITAQSIGTFAAGLKNADQIALKEAANHPLGIEKLIAGTDYRWGQYFTSLAARFGVSATTMAIQLRDLKLVVVDPADC